MSRGANLNNTQKERLPGWEDLVLGLVLFFVRIRTVKCLSKGVVNHLLYYGKGSFSEEL